jgi:hypothetical protein
MEKRRHKYVGKKKMYKKRDRCTKIYKIMGEKSCRERYVGNLIF